MAVLKKSSYLPNEALFSVKSEKKISSLVLTEKNYLESHSEKRQKISPQVSQAFTSAKKLVIIVEIFTILCYNSCIIEIFGGSPTQSIGRAAIAQSLLESYNSGMV